jgi:hypothetical protein
MFISKAGTDVHLISGNNIVLSPGFAVGNGATLSLKIDPAVAP